MLALLRLCCGGYFRVPRRSLRDVRTDRFTAVNPALRHGQPSPFAPAPLQDLHRHITGIRTARYRGVPKTRLEHTIATTAINMIRLDTYWTGRTRTTHLARLDFTLTA